MMKDTASSQRRLLILSLATLAGCDKLSAAAGLDNALAKPPYEDWVLKYKFRGLQGGELVVDAIGEKIGVNIFDETGQVFYQSAGLSIRNNSKHSYDAHFGVPKTLRAEWRDRYASSTDRPYVPPPPGHVGEAYYGGKILGNYTVPVASRIPDEVLDAVRSKKGGFRLKLRLHDDGLLIGWDLESRPSYDRSNPQSVYYPPAWTHTGGDYVEKRQIVFLETKVYPELAKYSDEHYRALGERAAPVFRNMTQMPTFFRESGGTTPEIFAKRGFALALRDSTFEFDYKNGEQVRKNPQTQWSLYEKGWYIHPKTKQRIETDF
jgi:hypothetical protein